MSLKVLYDGSSRKEVEGRSIDAFSVFKKGIRPEWEDEANRSGSELTCRKAMPFEVLDTYWENLVLGIFNIQFILYQILHKVFVLFFERANWRSCR